MVLHNRPGLLVSYESQTWLCSSRSHLSPFFDSPQNVRAKKSWEAKNLLCNYSRTGVQKSWHHFAWIKTWPCVLCCFYSNSKLWQHGNIVQHVYQLKCRSLICWWYFVTGDAICEDNLTKSPVVTTETVNSDYEDDFEPDDNNSESPDNG